MGLPDQHQIQHLAELARLTPRWCEEGLRQIAIEDISGVVATELKRLTAAHPNLETAKAHDRVQKKAHNNYAAKVVRPLILESLSLACWEDVVAFAGSLGIQSMQPSSDNVEYIRFRERLLNPQRVERLQSKGRVVDQNLDQKKLDTLWVQRQIGCQLGLNNSNIDRWEDSITLPSAENVFGAVFIALEDEFHNVSLSERSLLLTRAIYRTLAFIRERRYGKRSSVRAELLPTVEELTAVRCVLQHDFADVLLPNSQHRDRDQAKKLFTSVGRQLEGRFPEGTIHQPKTIKKAIDEWAMAYVHFRIALVSGWRDGTEDVWNWGEIDDSDSEF